MHYLEIYRSFLVIGAKSITLIRVFLGRVSLRRVPEWALVSLQSLRHYYLVKPMRVAPLLWKDVGKTSEFILRSNGEQMFASPHFAWYNMVDMGIHSSRHSMFLMSYYIVWMSKLRRAILHGEIRDVELNVL